ncbi:MAG: FAD-dependent oxidoreductase [Deltaproteobacteria bacterium]|nr:FAD-dependent oxidoreductase [Deltaproteobacteria bacterium]MBW2120225.1 FAD-dependent oxidoreductase [Deltaproteobacteria bacterium]
MGGIETEDREQGESSVTLPRLFSPIQVGRIEIRNRIAMAPMGTLGMVNPDGSLKSRVIDYYTERAKGGTGLIITGITKVERKIVNMPKANIPFISWNDASSYGELAERVHHFGSKVFVQLTAGFGRVSIPEHMEGVPVSASAIPNVWDPSIICRALETAEVEEIVKAFGDAAEIVAHTGCDGVELHGHEGYLLDQFATGIWNQREDRYGGPALENRLQFAIEIIREIKSRVGEDFPVCYRVGLRHMTKGLNRGALPGEEFEEAGRDLEEGLELLKILENAGVDLFHVDKGCYDSWYWAHPPVYMPYGNMIDMAREAKKVVQVPVIGVGRMDDPELAIRTIEEGMADIIAIGRGLLADPSWPNKVAEKRFADIRPCLGCQYGCMYRLRQKKPLSCSMNPACGREKTYGIGAADRKKRIVIIGGGVAGMEAARVAALRGHEVILYEKSERLGGHLPLIEKLSFKHGQERLLRYYLQQMEKLRVQVKYGVEVSGTMMETEDFDALLVATGSRAELPESVEIRNHEHVLTCVDLLKGERDVGNKIVVIGGGLMGCEVALWLRNMGKEVCVLEILPEILADGVQAANRQMLMDMLVFNRVAIRTNARAMEIMKDRVVYRDEKSGDRVEVEAEGVIFATGLRPVNALYRYLYREYPNVYAIGDCGGGRRIHDAIWSAYGLVRDL